MYPSLLYNRGLDACSTSSHLQIAFFSLSVYRLRIGGFFAIAFLSEWFAPLAVSAALARATPPSVGGGGEVGGPAFWADTPPLLRALGRFITLAPPPPPPAAPPIPTSGIPAPNRTGWSFEVKLPCL